MKAIKSVVARINVKRAAKIAGICVAGVAVAGATYVLCRKFGASAAEVVVDVVADATETIGDVVADAVDVVAV